MTKRRKPIEKSELQKLAALAAAHGLKLEKIRAGRKPVYDPDFHPEDYIRLCAEGKTKAAICAEWGIHRDSLHEWGACKKYPELTDALKRGEELRSAWWVNFALGIAGGQRPGSNATMTIFLMKNVCPNDFRDRIDHTHTLDVEDMEWVSS